MRTVPGCWRWMEDSDEERRGTLQQLPDDVIDEIAMGSTASSEGNIAEAQVAYPVLVLFLLINIDMIIALFAKMLLDFYDIKCLRTSRGPIQSKQKAFYSDTRECRPQIHETFALLLL
eukprot:scaffold8641_cov92-Amphora_coffeaeformis.AAC.4